MLEKILERKYVTGVCIPTEVLTETIMLKIQKTIAFADIELYWSYA